MDPHRQPGDFINLLLFFKNKENRLKIDDKATGWEAAEWIHLAQDREQSGALI
jgi:hypothetical protein